MTILMKTDCTHLISWFMFISTRPQGQVCVVLEQPVQQGTACNLLMMWHMQVAKFLYHKGSHSQPAEGDKAYGDLLVVKELRKLQSSNRKTVKYVPMPILYVAHIPSFWPCVLRCNILLQCYVCTSHKHVIEFKLSSVFMLPGRCCLQAIFIELA